MRPNLLGSSDLELSKVMETVNGCPDEHDQIDNYLSTILFKTQRNDMNATHGVTSSWARHEHVYPVLGNATRIIIDTPESPQPANDTQASATPI